MANQSTLQVLEDAVHQIYVETNRCYKEWERVAPASAVGFRILYGPPIFEPHYMLLGFQPGGKSDESDRGQHDRWPLRSWYLETDDPKNILAKKFKNVIDLNDSNHVGLNAVFFRAPNVARWKDVTSRSDLERFCILKAKRIVELSRPKILIVVGFKTLELVEPDVKFDTCLCQESGRRLIAKGELWGRSAYAIVHPSGARVSKINLAKMRTFFASRVS